MKFVVKLISIIVFKININVINVGYSLVDDEDDNLEN